MNSKKAYYFTLDAFIAVVILVIGFFLIRSTYTMVPESSSVEHISDDTLDLLSTAHAVKFGVLVKNDENTLLETLGERYHDGSDAGQIIENIIVDNHVIPNDHGFSVYVDNYKIYGDESSLEDAKSVVTARKVIFGYYEDESYNIVFWGPYEVKVKTWQI